MLRFNPLDVIERLWLYPSSRPASSYKPGEFYLCHTKPVEREMFSKMKSEDLKNVRWPLFNQ